MHFIASLTALIASLSLIAGSPPVPSFRKPIVQEAPAYVSQWLGENKHKPGSKFKDDHHLVDMEGGKRRLVKLQLWCGDWVHQMIPWYENLSGPKSPKHWQYGTTRLQSVYREIILNPGDYVSVVTYYVCKWTDGWKVCYLEIKTSQADGSAANIVKCGNIWGDKPQSVTTTGGEKDRALLSLSAAATDDGLIGMQTEWIERKDY